MHLQLPDWVDAQARRTIVYLIVSGLSLATSFLPLVRSLPFDPAWIAVILCGVPILKEAAEGLLMRFDIKADVLVSMALVASVAIGEVFAAGEIAWIMTIGALLEDLTVQKARDGIAELVKLSPEKAHVLRKSGEETIAADDVKQGDLVRVLPGEKIPTDGVVLEGASAVDESIMTGESMPVDKTPGSSVMSGTINQFGTFVMRATKVGKDSSVNRLIALVEGADAGKAKIVRLADRWATWVVVAALLSAAATWFVTGEIVRAVTILVVFCPCALVLATPTAVMAAIGNATRHGFLVRVGDALECLASVHKVALDKTGTLTKGKPALGRVYAQQGFDNDELLRLAACVETSSEHPLGKAIVEGFSHRNHSTRLAAVKNFRMIPGKGVEGMVEGTTIAVGSLQFVAGERRESGDYALLETAHALAARGYTVSFISVDGKLAGFVTFQDAIRPFAKKVISSLKILGLTPMLLTGDHKAAAEQVAASIGISTVIAQCLPETKLKFINCEQRQGQKIVMIGDGVNDAPALKCAHVGIAVAGAGNSIAMEAADIVMVGERIEEIPHLIRLSQKMMNVIRINLTMAMGINFVAVILAMGGWMGPVVGALVHNAGSVLVILHSASLLRFSSSER